MSIFASKLAINMSDKVSDERRDCGREPHHTDIPHDISFATTLGGDSRGQQPVVDAVSCPILHHWHVSASDSGTQTVVGLHRQPHLQSRALLHHPSCLPFLRRSARAQPLILYRHITRDTERIATDEANGNTLRYNHSPASCKLVQIFFLYKSVTVSSLIMTIVAYSEQSKWIFSL